MTSADKHKIRSCYKSHNKGGYDAFVRYAKVRAKMNESRKEQPTFKDKIKGIGSFIKSKIQALRNK